jgi:hypothetical protein
LSADDALLARLQAPPDLREGTEALSYWRRRRRDLPWYRVAARREAAQMTVVWERHVRAALIAQRGLSATAYLRAGQVLATSWFGRIAGRALLAFRLVKVAFVLLVVVAAALVLNLLIQAF